MKKHLPIIKEIALTVVVAVAIIFGYLLLANKSEAKEVDKVDQTASLCAKFALDVQSVMVFRQGGADILEAMAALGRPYYPFILSAYKTTRYLNPEMQELVIQEYYNQLFVACMDKAIAEGALK